LTADAAEAPCSSFSHQVEMLKADIEATHCVTDQYLGDVCDTFAKDAIVTCMKEDSVAARDDCMEDYFAAKNIDDDGYVLSGQEVLDCCKNRKYTEFYKLFEEAYSTVCPAENSAGARRKRSTYYSQHYDDGHYGLNTIWFQYHLCKDQGINCWFFTQGWNQGDFGSYYLYDKVFDEDVFDGDLDFATLLLLGSLGGGHGGHGGHGGSRYRRGADDEAGSSGCGENCMVCEGGECQDEQANDDRDPRFFSSWFKAKAAAAKKGVASAAKKGVSLAAAAKMGVSSAAKKGVASAAQKGVSLAAAAKMGVSSAAKKGVSLAAAAKMGVASAAKMGVDSASFAAEMGVDSAAKKGLSLAAAAAKMGASSAAKKGLSLAAAAKMGVDSAKGVSLAAAKKGVVSASAAAKKASILGGGVSKKVKSLLLENVPEIPQIFGIFG